MTTQTRWALMVAAVLGTGALAGCPPVAVNPSTQPAHAGLATGVGGKLSAASKLGDAPALGNEPVAKGVYVALDRRAPLGDKGLVKATMSRAEVLAAVTAVVKGDASVSTKPVAADGTAKAGNPGNPADEPRDTEPAPQAVKYYLQGRQRFLEGNNSAAMAALEKALQLDPEGFTVLRLMGRVCFAGSQLARGAMYLERAQALRPHDVEVNYLLGRYWLERNDNDKAVYYFLRAEDSPERLITSIHTPLTAFYMGIALQLGGYHLAAAKEYEHFLDVSEMPIPGYRYDPELSYLITMQWASHLAAAENFARLGDYHAALPHYKTAAAARPEDAFIGSRLVNALAHEGQMAPAQKAALALLTATRGSEDAVKLVAWTYKVAGREAELVSDLRRQLAAAPGAGGESGEQTAALTLASTQDYLGQKADAVRTLGAFLEKHPKNMDVLGRLLKRADSKAAFEEALAAAARAIAADRENSLAVLRLFLPVADGAAGVLYVKDGPSSKTKIETSAAFAYDYLRALVLQAQDEPPERVTAAFEASLKANDDFFPAREACVSYLLAQEKFDRATAVIDGMMKANASEPRAWQLQVESEVAQQRLVHARQLAQEARDKFPQDADLRMQLVTVLRLRGQDKEADAEAQGLIKDMPKYEIAYRSLVNALFVRSRRVGAAEANAAMTTIIATLNKMSVELPDSRFGRISSAIIYARGGRYDDSETILRSVLAVDPDEPDALVSLAQVVTIMGRPTEGTALLESSLKRKPQLDVVRSLASLYADENRKPDALALVKRYAEENPDSESFLLLYVSQLTTQEQRGEAATLLLKARTRFPRSQAIAAALARLQDEADDHEGAVATMRDFIKTAGETTERLYLLSHFFSTSGNEDASVAALQRVLTIMPDHIGANNDLGYFWVNAGIHLEQAEPMIRKALENKPDDPAFLDSLGWLYYKQGKFTEAAALLQKALSLPNGLAPEVVQHLGDTLYRMGRAPEAIEQWAKALQMLAISDRPSAADRKVQAYLTKAVTDAKAGRTPEISPVLEMDKSKAAGPATVPATMPQ